MNDEIMRELGFGREVDRVAKGLCPTCGEKVGSFKDGLSQKEYEISGMCQQCQDETFGEENCE